MDANPIDPALDPLSAVPGPDEETKRTAARSADAGTDESIAERLARNPESKEARLDRALDESMDASDPPASTQPVHSHRGGDLPESSGYDPRKEARLAQGDGKGVIGRILSKIGLG
ncbi:MAG: hypothetical protein IIZ38_11295 [Sphingomonas sp.]|uniref:hypothetical protein n=1 Tax=unclassified Sphingomonas TaxID=196159 RepID=UPI00245861C9|nr:MULTISPECIES: hypothetical protein [unclassified Sphingomonas]MBQ1498889.1 hypothetical protein [Sphingomonas sp.]MDH4746030.1 hypothetical protein [Sphingomonas sp. CBMAI 2297]